MKRLYFVSWGVDSRHLHDCKVFHRLKDARSEYELKAGAKKLHSLDFLQRLEPGSNSRVIAEVLR